MKMKRVLHLVIIIACILTSTNAYAQDVDSASISRELMRFSGNIYQFNQLFPQEKVYLEFDNTAYFQGETIWFKAFVTHATTLQRAPSKVLYVDLLAPTGHIVERLKLKIVAGQADGAFPLINAATAQAREKRGLTLYPSGFYEIRAYTQNMLDFSKEAIFSRVLPVYTKPTKTGEYNESSIVLKEKNPLVETIREQAKEPDDKINLMFYPEGGDLIEGLPCNVAFKATDKNGLPLEGVVVLKNNSDTIHTVHDGMGAFMITPQGTESVRFITESGNSTRFNLPKAVKSGYSMVILENTNSILNVKVTRTDDILGDPTGIAVTCRGNLIHFEELPDQREQTTEIDCSGWPVGVCRITLYDRKGKILSSRSLFHSNDQFSSPTITLTTDSLSRNPFSKEVLSLRLTDTKGNPIRDRFCLSIRDVSDYGSGQTDNLQTNLLLSSDLKGFIHDPAWYLESNDSLHCEALNLLTLVQGWERYEWKYMTGVEDYSERHRVEDSLTMNGWVLSYSKREPVPNVDVLASVVPMHDKSQFETFEYHTDTTGYFGFDLSDFYGQARMTINLMTHKRNGKAKYETNTRIKFERSDMPEARPYLKQETNLTDNTKAIDQTAQVQEENDEDKPLVIREDLGIILEDVDITEKRQFVDYDTFTAWDVAKETEMELDMGEYTTDVMGYFLEKGIRFEEYEPYFYVHDNQKVLDKKPFDIPYSIDMIDVKSIIVYDDGMYPRHFTQFTPLLVEQHRKHIDTDWFIWVDTCWDRYRLVDIQIKNERELLSYKDIRNLSRRTTTVEGFSEPVAFYSPQYPDGAIYGDVDVRRTLYWNPNVLTDHEGNARVEFYNNGYSRGYAISGAGITAGGTPYVLNQNW